MITKAITTDFPKESLKLLFLEADQVLVIQPPRLGLSIMTENFTMAVKKAISSFSTPKIPKLILCTAFTELFRNDPNFDLVITHEKYREFLREQKLSKKNLFVVDLTNDDHNKFLFEYDRMMKWPIKQRPYYSQVNFHWQNLPTGKGEENTIGSRYLILLEQIFGKNLFVKPRVPKVYLPKNSEEIYSKIVSEYNLNPNKCREISILYLTDNELKKIQEDWLVSLIEKLTKKKHNLEINIILHPNNIDKEWIKGMREKILKKQGFSLWRKKKLNFLSFNLSDLAVFLSKQQLVIGVNSGVLHLTNALGVKTISLQGPKSRHFISNYRWDNSIYPAADNCPYLTKTNTWKGKGLLTTCYYEGKCKKERNCISEISVDKVVEKAIEIL